MTPKSLFNIILKIFGLFFLREIILSVPEVFTTALNFFTDSREAGIMILILSFLVLAFYVFVAFQLLFRTNYYLDKLKLAEGFEEEQFSLQISGSAVLMIALIITGGLILINEIPNLGRELYSFYQQKRLMFGTGSPDFSHCIVSIFKILAGLLIIGERKRIVAFGENRQKKEEE